MWSHQPAELVFDRVTAFMGWLPTDDIFATKQFAGCGTSGISGACNGEVIQSGVGDVFVYKVFEADA